METKLSVLKKCFTNKQAELEKTKLKLKSEFFGIDHIIDSIIDNLSSWYMLNTIQEKPLVINLWGLTGVGKSSLVQRIVELLRLEDNFYKFDLGNKDNSRSFYRNHEDLGENKEDDPLIIALDEFQHARTVTGPFRTEVDKDYNRELWEIIDSGKITYMDWGRSIWDFSEYIDKLTRLIASGVTVEKGMVVSGKKLYLHEFEPHLLKNNFCEKHPVYFVDSGMYSKVIDYAGKELKLYLDMDVENILMTLNGTETIKFFEKVLRIAKRPNEKVFTKALIFILGNLDEAYTMSSNFNADINADDFHKLSLKITIPKVKQALRIRFRDEQIARLGNVHIIYPALCSRSYYKIIDFHLKLISKRLQELLGINIVFDKSIKSIIYKEGVYPTQGVRPVLTTINHLIKSNLSKFVLEIFKHSLTVNRLCFTFKGKRLVCHYYWNSDLKHTHEKLVQLSLEDLRESTCDDKQAICAVHESGHAIISALLLNTLPESIFSITADSDSEGFVFTKPSWDYIAKKEIVLRVAMILGGYAAEKVIFGEENLTAGSESDITKATEFVSMLYKTEGMNGVPIHYNIPSRETNLCYNKSKKIEEDIKSLIMQGLSLAETTLTREKKLLLKLADTLSDKSSLSKIEIKEIIELYAVQDLNFITDGNLLFYRNQLKLQVSTISENEKIKLGDSVCLNKTAKP